MTPTNRLRFVERTIGEPNSESYWVKVRVLQQWWEDKESSRFEPTGEWRDVPLAEEA
jgi:hypothetical protein